MIGELELIFFRSPTGERASCPAPSFANPTQWVTCKRRYCPRCGVRWAKNWEAVTATNLTAYRGPVALVSITAPGQDVLPWSCERDHKHSGWKGCRVVDAVADEWSESCRERWKSLREAARVATLRRTGGLKPSILERVWEPQKRGVSHLHVVLGMGTADERTAAEVFVHELHRLAPAHLFGFVDRKLELMQGSTAARYLSAYLLGRSRKKGTIRDNIGDVRMPRSLVWLTPVLTRRTLCTMRRIRYARWYFAARSGDAGRWPALRGQLLVDVARLVTLLDRQRGRQDDDEDEDGGPDELDPAALKSHIYALQAMRHWVPRSEWCGYPPPRPKRLSSAELSSMIARAGVAISVSSDDCVAAAA